MMKQPSGHNLGDHELAHLIQNGDTSAFPQLLQRYLPLLSRKANYYAGRCGLDAEDFIQEGLIALYRAVGAYKDTGRASFTTYASACIENGMVDAVRRFVKSSGKGSLSLNGMEERLLHKEVLPGLRETPLEDAYALREQLRMVMLQVERTLSGFERQVLMLRLQGYSYGQVSEKLGVSSKSVDNAMQRVKRKLKQNDW